MTRPDTVLLVDDDAALRRVLARDLRTEMEVITAETAPEALAILRAPASIGVVLSDLDLGAGGSGLEVLAAARRDAPAAGRILMTGSRITAAVEAALADGTIQAYLAKPFARDELFGAIARCRSGGPAQLQQ